MSLYCWTSFSAMVAIISWINVVICDVWSCKDQLLSDFMMHPKPFVLDCAMIQMIVSDSSYDGLTVVLCNPWWLFCVLWHSLSSRDCILC